MMSEKTSRASLKCKYCGAETPLLLFDDGWNWVPMAATHTQYFNDWVTKHGNCQRMEGQHDDRQPFLLSWS